MHGFVLGGGMGLVQGAALRVIGERTRMGMPETAIGYFPDVGASHFLSRLRGNLGIYLGVTGNQVDCADALYAGLADYCLPEARFAELERRLDEQDWRTPASLVLTALLAELAARSCRNPRSALCCRPSSNTSPTTASPPSVRPWRAKAVTPTVTGRRTPCR